MTEVIQAAELGQRLHKIKRRLCHFTPSQGQTSSRRNLLRLGKDVNRTTNTARVGHAGVVQCQRSIPPDCSIGSVPPEVQHEQKGQPNVVTWRGTSKVKTFSEKTPKVSNKHNQRQQGPKTQLVAKSTAAVLVLICAVSSSGGKHDSWNRSQATRRSNFTDRSM